MFADIAKIKSHTKYENVMIYFCPDVKFETGNQDRKSIEQTNISNPQV